jgi:hypothetical protein
MSQISKILWNHFPNVLSIPLILMMSFLVFHSFAHAGAPNSNSILMLPISPTSNFLTDEPVVTIMNGPLHSNEAGACSDKINLRRLCQYSALDDTFTGMAPPRGSDYSSPVESEAVNRFRNQIAVFLDRNNVKFVDIPCNPVGVTPGGPRCAGGDSLGNPQFKLFTYSQAYETSQLEFLRWFKLYDADSMSAPTESGKTSSRAESWDFLPPQARKMNSFTGDKHSPLIGGDEANASALKSSFGSQVYFTKNTAVMQTDNRYNPYRWVAPINEILHHEQPSLGLVLNASPNGISLTKKILADALTGTTSRHIVLYYDLTIGVQDYRAAMSEYTAIDMLNGSINQNVASLSDAYHEIMTKTDLFSTTIKNTYIYTATLGNQPVAEQIRKYFATRYLKPTIQLSIAVNFQQDHGSYRNSEFLIAGKNYFPSQTEAFAPIGTTDSASEWVPLIPEGGNNGVHAAWTRLKIDALRQPRVNHVDRSQKSIQEGEPYFDIPDGNATRHLTGAIDLTEYYWFAMKERIFPGTSGVWNNFDVPSSLLIDSATKKPALEHAENHEVNWVGVVYEVHGPFALQVHVNLLDVQIQQDGTPLNYAGASGVAKTR